MRHFGTSSYTLHERLENESVTHFPTVRGVPVLIRLHFRSFTIGKSIIGRIYLKEMKVMGAILIKMADFLKGNAFSFKKIFIQSSATARDVMVCL